MSTNGKFAGGNFRFDVIDRSGVYPLNDSYAAACGFTYSFNLPGDLIFRASFLACHVESVNDVSYALQYRFVRLDSLGRETVYPFSLSCSTESPWNPREIVCEDKYMEVSVRKNVPVIAQEGLEKEDWEAALSIAQGAVMSVWQVVFHQTGMTPKTMTTADARTAGYLVNSTSSRVIFRSPYGMPMSEVLLAQGAVMSVWQVVFHPTGMTPKTMTAADARTAGYLVNSTSSRVIFRSPYGMPMSEVLLVSGVPVEVIRATVFYKQRWMLLLVDTSAACAKNPSVFDGTYLSWVTPRLITPLVLHPTKFLDKRFMMGVDGRALDEVTAISRGYQLLVNRTAVEICIPFGAVGGYRKSHVIDNKYNQVYEIDLFLEHQWADDLWEVTQHRSFKPARSPYLPETPYVVNNTVPSEKGFTVTLGNFKPDVELKNLTLNGVPLILPEAQNRGYIGALIRRYTLNINYTLNIVPQNEPYFHPAAIVCDVKDVNLPDVKSFCTNRSMVFEVTLGNMDSSWELCIGSRPLPYTIAEPKITIELPLFSIGYIYEGPASCDVSLASSLPRTSLLRGLTVRVELNMRNVKTLQVEKQFVQRCPIPTRELLVCFPNGVVTVVAVTMEPIPVVDPSKTTLLDKTCKPKEFDSTRALFTFGVNTCRTRSQGPWFGSSCCIAVLLLLCLSAVLELLLGWVPLGWALLGWVPLGWALLGWVPLGWALLGWVPLGWALLGWVPLGWALLGWVPLGWALLGWVPLGWALLGWVPLGWALLGWVPLGWALLGWVPLGWALLGWVPLGWALLGWVPLGWALLGWVPLGWALLGWVPLGWALLGWVPLGWALLGWVPLGWALLGWVPLGWALLGWVPLGWALLGWVPLGWALLVALLGWALLGWVPLGWALLGWVPLGWAGSLWAVLCWAGSLWVGLCWAGSLWAGLGSAGLGPSGLGSAGLGSAGLGPSGLGSAGLGSAGMV
ncbi:UNVERIFIED_CONTAM: hypothetical protein FKN15_016668 [Acipenser sinensis]